jgi:hypothetical protein
MPMVTTESKPFAYVNPPLLCDICSCPVGSEFVDGKTLAGSWAEMCMGCHKKHGLGLGIGKGQHYRRESIGEPFRFVATSIAFALVMYGTLAGLPLILG